MAAASSFPVAPAQSDLGTTRSSNSSWRGRRSGGDVAAAAQVTAKVTHYFTCGPHRSMPHLPHPSWCSEAGPWAGGAEGWSSAARNRPICRSGVQNQARAAWFATDWPAGGMGRPAAQQDPQAVHVQRECTRECIPPPGLKSLIGHGGPKWRAAAAAQAAAVPPYPAPPAAAPYPETTPCPLHSPSYNAWQLSA